MFSCIQVQTKTNIARDVVVVVVDLVLRRFTEVVPTIARELLYLFIYTVLQFMDEQFLRINNLNVLKHVNYLSLVINGQSQKNALST